MACLKAPLSLAEATIRAANIDMMAAVTFMAVPIIFITVWGKARRVTGSQNHPPGTASAVAARPVLLTSATALRREMRSAAAAELPD
ncbi:MAG: hypothetical protein AAFP79_16955 [Pseudomonadota bacterium]